MGGVGEVAGADDTSKDSLLAGGKPQIGQDTGGRGRDAGSYIPRGGEGSTVVGGSEPSVDGCKTHVMNP